ncbi:flagellar basal body rod protein FlgB [Paenibacillus abyssi]|uniref:Flagellar basal body rod protein FlgB n=1 Tax=Paenibacillus abyssi TaxID=1340531 RepID=A0A917G237_9BACL|nr:flagellar basal body rod protein FlgB [Paenibacillus abyssi]GGG19028.1 flagellar basal body rod protein FlgB [Paenibacillus abyssi]
MIHSSRSRMNEALLNILTIRHNVITDNIANADTPNYKTKSVVFQEELKRKLLAEHNQDQITMKRTHPKHLPQQDMNLSEIPFKITESTDKVINNNGNNVDIDAEMAKMAENQLFYNYMAGRVSGHYTKMKTLLQDLK